MLKDGLKDSWKMYDYTRGIHIISPTLWADECWFGMQQYPVFYVGS